MINSRPGMTLTSEEKEADVFGPKNSSFVFFVCFLVQISSIFFSVCASRVFLLN